MKRRPLVGVTMGDPGGIGAEVIVGSYPTARERARLAVIGDADVMASAIDVVDAPLTVRRIDDVEAVGSAPDTIDVLDLNNVSNLAYGELRTDYGEASLAYIERAIDLSLDGSIDAMVTAPINKQATRAAGSTHAGHTGLLAERTGTERYSMMLIEEDLRVTHVSAHVPLREACDLVTTQNVLNTIEVTADGLERLGLENPDIAVAGLNPHASDGGLLGSEDADEIEPAVERARERGLSVVGPESPDTIYVRAARGEFDCVVSMYHDEGHIPIKMLGFSSGGTVSGVNMTVGLPIIRTSVDHGTAFDIAGEGVASAASMVDAIDTAVRATRHPPE